MNEQTPSTVMRRGNYTHLAIIWLLLLLAPYLLGQLGVHISLITSIMIYGLAAMAVNLLLGFTGGLSFGHAAYFGLGAYGTGLALKYLTQNTPLAIVIGVSPVKQKPPSRPSPTRSRDALRLPSFLCSPAGSSRASL